MTKLSSALPKGDHNGLGPIVPSLVSEPHCVHVVIALVDCKALHTDHDTGDVIPTARIRRIEAVLPIDHEHAEHMLRRAFEQRTGKAVLPYDLEQDVREAFHGVDHRTGEAHRPPRDDDEPGSDK